MDDIRPIHTASKPQARLVKPETAPRQRPLVDPFIVAGPTTARPMHVTAHPDLAPQPKLAQQKSPVRQATHVIRSVDGFVPIAKPPSTPISLTPDPPVVKQHRPFAAGPSLYMKYRKSEEAPHSQPRIESVPSRSFNALEKLEALNASKAPISPVEAKPQPAPAKLEPIVEQVPEPTPTSTYEPSFESQSEADIIQKLTQPLPARSSAKARVKKAAKMSGWALVGLIVLGGLSLFSQATGEIALGIYAVVALWRRWPSQQTFALALMMFVGIIIASSLTSVTAFTALNNITQTAAFEDIGRNLAVYAFLLLCIGTMALAREVRKDSPVSVSVSPEIQKDPSHA